MKCQIQWISKEGKPTPDENEAVAFAHVHHVNEESLRERNVRYKETISKTFPICQEHLDSVPYTIRYENGGGWEFVLIDALDLDEWIQLEDALDAIGQQQSLDAFVTCHKIAHQPLARTAYLKAVDLIAHYESRHRALAFVQQQIKLQGASDAEVHPKGIPQD